MRFSALALFAATACAAPLFKAATGDINLPRADRDDVTNTVVELETGLRGVTDSLLGRALRARSLKAREDLGSDLKNTIKELGLEDISAALKIRGDVVEELKDALTLSSGKRDLLEEVNGALAITNGAREGKSVKAREELTDAVNLKAIGDDLDDVAYVLERDDGTTVGEVDYLLYNLGKDADEANYVLDTAKRGEEESQDAEHLLSLDDDLHLVDDDGDAILANALTLDVALKRSEIEGLVAELEDLTNVQGQSA